MTLFQQLKAKQKTDSDKRDVRLAKRRGYARTARERAIAATGLQDLPVETQVVVQETLKAVSEEPTLQTVVKSAPETSVEELVTRLSNIKDRLFRLHAVYAVSLSHDIYHEADRYRQLFQELGSQLSAEDPDAFDALIVGHEALLLAEPLPSKPTLSLAVQEWFELSGQVQYTPAPPKRPTVSDGLD